MRNILFPVFDIAPCLKQHPERTDFVMRKMQEYLQRNSNGFKHTGGQGFRLQHGFLLSSTHQLVDKLVSETQETISFRQTGHSSVDSAVQRLIDDAENSKQLLPKLQEAVRCDQHPIEVKLSRMANDLSQNIRSYLIETMETMLRTGVEQCPKTLGNQNVINDLRKNCQERLHITDEFLHTCIMNNAGGEIMNKIRFVLESATFFRLLLLLILLLSLFAGVHTCLFVCLLFFFFIHFNLACDLISPLSHSKNLQTTDEVNEDYIITM